MLQAIDHFDKTLTEGINAIDFPAFLNWIFKALTFLGEYGFVWILLGVCFLIFMKDKAPAISMLLALLLCFLLNDFVLKALFERPRPFQALDNIHLIIKPPSGYSFPSGHSANGFAAVFGFFFLTNSKWRYALVALGSLIALSRLYLMVHYFSDIVVGMLLGAFMGFVVSLLVRGWYARYHRRRGRR